MFQYPMLTLRDDRVAYAEEGWIGLGFIKRLVGVVVYTERRGEVIRIISARKASRQETRRYVQSIEN